MPATVVDNTEHTRFEVRTDDGTVPGILEYQIVDGVVSLLHTKVEPKYEGNGYGSMLVRAALDAARKQRLSVLPHCWFVRDLIAREPQDYLDLVPEDRRAGFRL